MKKYWRVVLLASALTIAFGITHPALGQDVIVGGYGDASLTDPDVLAATRFAVARESRKAGSRISLVSIERAQVQVVAGLNYKVWLKVRKGGKNQNVTAVVYKNLKQRYSLTSWDLTASIGSIVDLMTALGDAYISKTLSTLDPGRPYVGKFRIIVEHSLAEDTAPDRFEIRSFRTMAAAERWLRSRELEDTPARATLPLEQCRAGVCTFKIEGGISHNQVYLKKVTYGYQAGRPIIKNIYLLDGD